MREMNVPSSYIPREYKYKTSIPSKNGMPIPRYKLFDMLGSQHSNFP